jgi:hypothetical protein
MTEKLIDRIGTFTDFAGDPTNPDDLYEYFHKTGKLYTALAVGGNSPQFSYDFMSGDEAQRVLCFAMLSSAVATLLRHKGVVDIEKMTPLELSKAVRQLTTDEIPARYKRQLTGRNNDRSSSGARCLLEEAYREIRGGNRRTPGSKKLAHTPKKCVKKNLPSAPDRYITEHAVKKFLQSQTKSGEI